MIDITSISALVAATGVIVGVVFTVLELRNLVKTRQTDLVMKLYSTMTNKEWLESWEKVRDREIEDYESYKKKYGFVEVNAVSTFFEGIGVLLRRKLVDIGLIEDLFSIEVKTVWEKLKPAAEDIRQRSNEPRQYSNLEYLYNEVKKREQQLAKSQ